MKPLELTQYRVAVDIGVGALRINQIVHGKRAIKADTELRLARYFGTTPGIWLRLQARYDLEVAQAKAGKAIRREVKKLRRDAGRRRDRRLSPVDGLQGRALSASPWRYLA